MEALLTGGIQLGSTGVNIADARGLDMPLIYVNEAFQETAGYLSSEVLGRNCHFLRGPDTEVADTQALGEAPVAGEDHVSVLRNYRKDATSWWNELRVSAVRDDTGTVTHYFGFHNDVTGGGEAERMVAYLAAHDPLTGLPNRARLLAASTTSCSGRARGGAQVAVLFIDLDAVQGRQRLARAQGRRPRARGRGNPTTRQPSRGRPARAPQRRRVPRRHHQHRSRHRVGHRPAGRRQHPRQLPQPYSDGTCSPLRRG